MILYRDDSVRAFEVLYLRYSQQVYAYLCRKIEDRGIADDVFQKTFLKLHKSRHRYSGEIAFNKWIYTICKSELIDHFRAQTREAKNLQVLLKETKNMRAQSPINLEFETLEKGLSSDEKQILRLRYNEDLEFQEIAEKIGISAASVRKRVSRIIAKLRRSYESKRHG